jgi:hypothetical protein
VPPGLTTIATANRNQRSRATRGPDSSTIATHAATTSTSAAGGIKRPLKPTPTATIRRPSRGPHPPGFAPHTRSRPQPRSPATPVMKSRLPERSTPATCPCGACRQRFQSRGPIQHVFGPGLDHDMDVIWHEAGCEDAGGVALERVEDTGPHRPAHRTHEGHCVWQRPDRDVEDRIALGVRLATQPDGARKRAASPSHVRGLWTVIAVRGTIVVRSGPRVARLRSSLRGPRERGE